MMAYGFNEYFCPSSRQEIKNMTPDERCEYIKYWFYLSFANTHQDYDYKIDTGRNWLHLKLDSGPRFSVENELCLEFAGAVSKSELLKISNQIIVENPPKSEWVAGLLNENYATGFEKSVTRTLMYNIKVVRQQQANKKKVHTSPWLKAIQVPFWILYIGAGLISNNGWVQYFSDGSDAFNSSGRFFIYGMLGCLFYAYSESKKTSGVFFDLMGKAVTINMAFTLFLFIFALK
jgi:hypothetical protein